jgi:hypothetical protein
MSGGKSRDKGLSERSIVRPLQAEGIAPTQIRGMYRPGADITGLQLGCDLDLEDTELNAAQHFGWSR